MSDQTESTRQIGKFWALSDVFRVVDAVALVAGIEPTKVYWFKPDNGRNLPTPHSIDANNLDPGLADLETVLSAISNAIREDKLPATVRYSAREYGYADAVTDMDYREAGETAPFGMNPEYGNTADEDEEFHQSEGGSFFYKQFPDWFETTVARDDLVSWLESRRFPVPFFGLESEGKPAYLDREHPRYSPKLAAAVRAWEAMEDDELWSGQSPKSAATKWLESHYSELDLVTTDRETGKRKMNQTGIEQAAAVVNWRPQGGSPKTPGGD
ncbi:hypothetical protein ABGV17_05860 [Guyparkeria sp. GHLCS8-2]|uniref:hypothetical protein n=1 Tax=Guyparkeria halopsychrophila TaxID=3139421 RepID=UPI0037C66A4E